MKGTILIAEDEISGEYEQRFLESEGYFVMLYTNGKDLADDIQGGLKYDLAIVDLSLPEVDGTEIIELSKKLNPLVPILSMSGYSFKPKDSTYHFVKPFFTDRNFFKTIESYFSNSPT